MAVDRYLRSTDGSDADNGTTWALAKATLAGLAGIDTAGDRLFVSQVHAEAPATAQTITLAGTISNPTHVLCGNDGAQPPTALATTAVVSTTGASAIITSGHAYVYGITFIAGDGTSIADIRLADVSNNSQLYDNCSFQLGGSATSSRIYPVNAAINRPSEVAWKDCTVKFGGTSQRIDVLCGTFRWSGGSVLSGGANVTTFLGSSSGSTAVADIRNVDLSNLVSTVNLVNISDGMRVTFANCKLPASWSGGLTTGTKLAAFRAEMYNCDSGDTNYVCWIEDAYGTVKDFSTLYLSGTDGIKLNTAAVPLSYRMTGNANTGFPLAALAGMWRTLVNEVTTSQTATLEIIHNESADLNDDEIWLEVEYPATSGSTQFTRLSDAKTDVLATGAAQATSTADWDDGITARADLTAYVLGNMIKVASNPGRVFICTTAGTTGVSEPAGYATAVDGDSITDTTATFKAMRRQKIAVTFTSAEQGIIKARPVLAKVNAVVWTAAKLTVA